MKKAQGIQITVRLTYIAFATVTTCMLFSQVNNDLERVVQTLYFIMPSRREASRGVLDTLKQAASSLMSLFENIK